MPVMPVTVVMAVGNGIHASRRTERAADDRAVAAADMVADHSAHATTEHAAKQRIAIAVTCLRAAGRNQQRRTKNQCQAVFRFHDAPPLITAQLNRDCKIVPPANESVWVG